MTLPVHKYLIARVASTIAGTAIIVANWWLWGYWPDRMTLLPDSLVYRALVFGFQVYVCTFLGFMIAESVSRFWWNRWKPARTSIVKTTAVRVAVGDTTIPGQLHEPLHLQDRGPRGFIIASHGINDTPARAMHWILGMVAAGFAVFTWEYRGRGGRKGRVTDMAGHVQDLATVIGFCHEHLAGGARGRLHLVGWSLGGMASILAGMEDPRVGRIFAWSTWSRLGSVLWRIYANPVSLIRYAVKGQLAFMREQDRDEVSPARHIGALKARIGKEPFRKTVAPKLFLAHARDDRLVPVANFYENCRVAGLPARNQALFPHGSHLLLRRETEIIGLIHEFLTRDG